MVINMLPVELKEVTEKWNRKTSNLISMYSKTIHMSKLLMHARCHFLIYVFSSLAFNQTDSNLDLSKISLTWLLMLLLNVLLLLLMFHMAPLCRFYFDFSPTYIGCGLICPHIVNCSVLFGAIISWGFLWPFISAHAGDWYPSGLDSNNFKGLYGYKVHWKKFGALSSVT